MLRNRAPFAISLLFAVSCGGNASSDPRDAAPDGPGLLPAGTHQAAPVRICHREPLVPRLPGLSPHVMIVFDRSGSMSAAFGASTRYDAAAQVLTQLTALYDDKIRFGYQAFPGENGCDGAASGCCVDLPAVALGPDNGPRISRAIAAAAPVSGNTPTAAALRRARVHFQSLDPGIEDRYVLLATDGHPSCTVEGQVLGADVEVAGGFSRACTESLVEIEGLLAGGVTTLVMGIGPSLDEDPSGRPSCLDEMARRGGAPRPTRPAFYAATNTLEMERALEQIFGGVSRPSCTVDLKMPPPDPALVLVVMDGREIPRGREHGWDFDPPGMRQRIRLFGEYCRRLERFHDPDAEVRYRCPPCEDPSACE